MNRYDMYLEVYNDSIKFSNSLSDLCDAYLSESNLNYSVLISCLCSKVFDLHRDRHIEELVNSFCNSGGCLKK